ncbi:MAG: ATP-binding cassette domain-containing protein, partial [Candidatus Korarchaeota archaeon]
SILDKKTMKTHIRKLVEKFNLTINEDKKIGQLSEEERQMLTILKALDQNPQILLLDESFTFLSLRRASEIVKLLKNIRENYKCSILFVSHDMMLVKSLADKILILRNGKMVFFGKSQEITLEGIVRYIRGK